MLPELEAYETRKKKYQEQIDAFWARHPDLLRQKIYWK